MARRKIGDPPATHDARSSAMLAVAARRAKMPPRVQLSENSLLPSSIGPDRLIGAKVLDVESGTGYVRLGLTNGAVLTVKAVRIRGAGSVPWGWDFGDRPPEESPKKKRFTPPRVRLDAGSLIPQGAADVFANRLILRVVSTETDVTWHLGYAGSVTLRVHNPADWSIDFHYETGAAESKKEGDGPDG